MAKREFNYFEWVGTFLFLYANYILLKVGEAARNKLEIILSTSVCPEALENARLTLVVLGDIYFKLKWISVLLLLLIVMDYFYPFL
jgi:hypothetical protein